MRRLSKDLLDRIDNPGEVPLQINDAICETVDSFIDDDAIVEAIFKSIPMDWVHEGSSDPTTKLEFVLQYIYETLGLTQRG